MNRTWVKKQMERKRKYTNDGYHNQHITPNTNGEMTYEHGSKRNHFLFVYFRHDASKKSDRLFGLKYKK